ncbi:ankyrin repeat-containing-like protein [Cinnamomum micranthum f. kanehirae]|uniref:Ankyrin repeat-containing-like protein n=1 Tax=Cinnamomum micranthum f. kanehirae TaxID=337451 RepID=A0A3S4PGN4_9MAGN|nr:ankyrin repeat-containing-like protein [Cinnamomum micranthum f. kanehirae]
MDKRLYEAALAGSTSSLLELLWEDELILDRVLVGSATGNPLHIAAILGHVDFARAILTRKPDFAFELNSQGSSPLHLAAANGFTEIVHELLNVDSSGNICLVRDRDGRTAVHAAAIKGRLAVLQKLLQAKPEAGHIKTDQGETILHLSVKHNHYEMVRWVLEWLDDDDDDEFVNMKDDYGSTALHISVAKMQIQVVQLLFGRGGVEVNATNTDGLTPLDVLLQQNRSESTVIGGLRKILEDAGATGVRLASTTHVKNKPNLIMKNEHKENRHRMWLSERWNSLIVVAILIATITFDAGLRPPKGLDNQEMRHLNYRLFMLMDTIAFLLSLSAIILLISKPPFRPTVLMRVVVVFIWISVTFVALTFGYYIAAVQTEKTAISHVPLYWLGFLYLWQFIRFVLWLLRAYGILKRKEMSAADGDIEMGAREQV